MAADPRHQDHHLGDGPTVCTISKRVSGTAALILLDGFRNGHGKDFLVARLRQDYGCGRSYAAGLAIVYAFAGIPACTDAAEPDFQGGHRSG